RRRHTRFSRDWSSDVCSSDLGSHLVGIPKTRYMWVQVGGVDNGCSLGTPRKALHLIPLPLVPVVGLLVVRLVALDPRVEQRPRRSEERRVGKECGCTGARESA